MNCPDCQREIPSDSRFCCYCGQRLSRCEPCELFFSTDSTFCGSCGGELPVEKTMSFEPPQSIPDDVRGYIYDPDDPTEFSPLCDGDTTVGAGGHNDISVDHPTISWNHAVFLCRSDSLRVQDSASTNGTFVDGEPVHKPRRLDHQSTVKFGSRAFQVWLVESLRSTAQ